MFLRIAGARSAKQSGIRGVKMSEVFDFNIIIKIYHRGKQYEILRKMRFKM